VHCLNPQRSNIETLQMNRMASQGIIFSDAHSSFSVCRPTLHGIRKGASARTGE
jgi:arylsulfatase A-like enzyme